MEVRAGSGGWGHSRRAAICTLFLTRGKSRVAGAKIEVERIGGDALAGAVTLTNGQLLVAAWLAATSGVAFVMFGYDKWQAGRQGGRVAEATLCLASALGGWPGGLLGILVFRHKSAKASFQFKFAAAFAVWVGLLWVIWRAGGFR
jgi:uncharacterized membrane protein YsdA (DUF1294 family)